MNTTPTPTMRACRCGCFRTASILILFAAIAGGCSRKPLPPTVGEPQDIMKNADGVVGPMPGTPGYKPPKNAK